MEIGREDLSESLVLKLRSGDSGAGRCLDAVYRPALMRFCQAYLGRKQDAEDAVQEIFVKVLGDRRVPQNFRAWIYRIARNHCLRWQRDAGRRKDREPMTPELVIPLSVTGQLTRLVQGERRAAITAALTELAPQERELLLLRYTEGLSREETAEVLELPISLVKSRSWEAMKKLRRLLERQE